MVQNTDFQPACAFLLPFYLALKWVKLKWKPITQMVTKCNQVINLKGNLPKKKLYIHYCSLLLVLCKFVTILNFCWICRIATVTTYIFLDGPILIFIACVCLNLLLLGWPSLAEENIFPFILNFRKWQWFQFIEFLGSRLYVHFPCEYSRFSAK